ncbi:hypothetical protein L915_20850 [Phytophthora nicotianae]|uniref:Uncharacterized protein n=1 Tax=Phytophthora nicotianae TaxID=4792 RepID=W2FMJ3_PHYNI|nr:hypothetical protein L915_20850 [Phytophthora nicotianae]
MMGSATTLPAATSRSWTSFFPTMAGAKPVSLTLSEIIAP